MTIALEANNQVGTFIGRSDPWQGNAKMVTYTGVFGTSDTDALTDTSDTLRMGIEAQFPGGADFVHVAWGPFWTGGAGQVAPAVSYTPDTQFPPLRTRPKIECVTAVKTKAAISFA